MPGRIDAATVDAIIAETAARITERGATRLDDQTSDASMELRKKDGILLMNAQLRNNPADARAGLLRFITAGSVDDGKSTLIGRLLYDRMRCSQDQLARSSATAQRGETSTSRC